MTIIAFAGKAGSGKDTAADTLCTEFGYTRCSFAASLKDAIAAIFNWPRNLLEGDTPESREWREREDAWWSARLGKPITPRGMLQIWGTELGRGFHSEMWIASLERKLSAGAAAAAKIVITDCRFDNEAEMIRRLGGTIVHIERDTGASAATKHVSEAGLTRHPDDIIIQNTGTIEKFRYHVRRLIDCDLGVQLHTLFDISKHVADKTAIISEIVRICDDYDTSKFPFDEVIFDRCPLEVIKAIAPYINLDAVIEASHRCRCNKWDDIYIIGNYETYINELYNHSVDCDYYKSVAKILNLSIIENDHDRHVYLKKKSNMNTKRNE